MYAPTKHFSVLMYRIDTCTSTFTCCSAEELCLFYTVHSRETTLNRFVSCNFASELTKAAAKKKLKSRRKLFLATCNGGGDGNSKCCKLKEKPEPLPALDRVESSRVAAVQGTATATATSYDAHMLLCGVL